GYVMQDQFGAWGNAHRRSQRRAERAFESLPESLGPALRRRKSDRAALKPVGNQFLARYGQAVGNRHQRIVAHDDKPRLKTPSDLNVKNSASRWSQKQTAPHQDPVKTGRSEKRTLVLERRRPSRWTGHTRPRNELEGYRWSWT